MNFISNDITCDVLFIKWLMIFINLINDIISMNDFRMELLVLMDPFERLMA